MIDDPVAPPPWAAAGRVPRGGPAVRRVLRTVRRWVVSQLLLAVTVGVGWWMLAPGGLRPSADTYLGVIEAPAIQDGWFAGLAAAAGALVAMVWVARRPDVPDGPSAIRLVGAVVGALVAGVVAVAAGVGLDTLSSGDPAADDVVHTLRLQSPAAVLLWPMAVVLLVLVDTLRDLVVGSVRDLVTAARHRRDTSETDAIS